MEIERKFACEKKRESGKMTLGTREQPLITKCYSSIHLLLFYSLLLLLSWNKNKTKALFFSLILRLLLLSSQSSERKRINRERYGR